MNRAKAAIFSLTPPAGREDDGSYCVGICSTMCPRCIKLPDIQYAPRCITDGKYLDSRIAEKGRFEQVGNVVNYLVGDPEQQTQPLFAGPLRTMIQWKAWC